MASLDDNGASYFESSVASTTTTLHSQEFHRVPVIDPQQQQQQERQHQQERQGPRTDNDTVGVVGVPYITASTWLYCLGAALNSCNLGYDIGVSTGAGPLVQDDLNLTTFQREVFLGSMNFWSILGALGAHWVSDKYGRRYTFLVAALCFILGVVLLALAPNYTILLLGRFWVGIGVGIGLAIDPMYIAELSPAARRGELVTYSEIALNVGLVLGFASGPVLSTLSVPPDRRWRIMFALGAIMPLVLIGLVLTVLPESPRWLIAHGRDMEAIHILKRTHPPHWKIEAVVSDIRESLHVEAVAHNNHNRASSSGVEGWKALLVHPTPAIQRMLLVGVCAAIAQQAIGIDAIQYYLLDVLAQSGLTSDNSKQDVALIGLGLIKLGFIFVGGQLFDRKGRRPLLLTSLLGTAVSTLAIAVTFLASSSSSSNSTPNAGFVVTGLACYLAFFSVGMGPGGWLIPSEVFFATCFRAKAMSVATVANRLTATFMASTFLSMAALVGWGPFFLLLSLSSVLWAWAAHQYLPETRRKSLEDMANYFATLTGDDSVLEAEARLLHTGGGGASHPSVELTTASSVARPPEINPTSSFPPAAPAPPLSQEPLPLPPPIV